MLERKYKIMPKETVRLFILLFISLLYALFKFSANLPSMPEIHSIPLLFTGSLAVDNGDHLRYCTVPPTSMYLFLWSHCFRCLLTPLPSSRKNIEYISHLYNNQISKRGMHTEILLGKVS